MKYNIILLNLMFLIVFNSNLSYADNLPIKMTLPTKSASGKKTKSTVPEKPNLKKNEYSLNIDNKIKIFSTERFEGLNLSSDCFKNKIKNKKPTCDAYTKSLTKPTENPQDKMITPYHNNFGAINCELIGGKGLIAKTSTGDEDDFCLFKDGSMVSSWSAYYKTKK